MTRTKSRPLLSVVVPTRDRQQFASSLLYGIQAFDTLDLEVIIQDNSEASSLERTISDLNDCRIRYFYNAEPLTMHQNFECAIDNASGEYVCAIGDDDGINIPVAISSLLRARSNGVDALLTEIYSYSWPGIKHRVWGEIGGPIFSVRCFPGLARQSLDPELELWKLFNRGTIGGLGLLPRVYQGFVSRACLLALKERAGTYFPGASPDMANAVGLVPFVKNMHFEPEFALISGHSPNSGGGQGASGRHHGELDDIVHLPPNTISTWDPAIPRFWSGTTVYAQSAIEATRAVGISERYNLNYLRIYTACLLYQPTQYHRHIQNSLRTSDKRWSDLWLPFFFEYLLMITRRIRTFIRNFSLYCLHIKRIGHFNNMHEIMIHLIEKDSTQSATGNTDETQ